MAGFVSGAFTALVCVALGVTAGAFGLQQYQRIPALGPRDDISLSQALVSTMAALNDAKAASQKGGNNFGLYACTVTATFNIAATSSVGGGLKLGADPGEKGIFPGLMARIEAPP